MGTDVRIHNIEESRLPRVARLKPKQTRAQDKLLQNLINDYVYNHSMTSNGKSYTVGPLIYTFAIYLLFANR